MVYSEGAKVLKKPINKQANMSRFSSECLASTLTLIQVSQPLRLPTLLFTAWAKFIWHCVDAMPTKWSRSMLSAHAMREEVITITFFK